MLTQIDVDRDTEDLLEKLNYTFIYNSKSEEVVFLKSTANLSTGGTSVDVTDMMHLKIYF
jgi:cyanophycin synthetase